MSLLEYMGKSLGIWIVLVVILGCLLAVEAGIAQEASQSKWSAQFQVSDSDSHTSIPGIIQEKSALPAVIKDTEDLFTRTAPYSLSTPSYVCSSGVCTKNTQTSNPLLYRLGSLSSPSQTGYSTSGISSSSSIFSTSTSTQKNNYKNSFTKNSYNPVGYNTPDLKDVWSPTNFASTTHWTFTGISSGGYSGTSSGGMSVPNPFAGSNVAQNGVFWNPSKGL